MQLISTNVRTISATAAEAQYGERGAQDSAALAPTRWRAAVTPFSTPPQIANPTAQGTQAAGRGHRRRYRPVDADFEITGYPTLSLTTSLLQSSNGPLSWLWQIH